MHAWTTTRPVNTEKFQRAISALEVLSETNSKLVFDALKEHHNATFLELMICTRLSSDKLEAQLEMLCSTGAIMEKKTDWQSCFSIDKQRLSRLLACAKALARGVAF